MRSPTRARSARSAVVAGVAALALATGGFAYGASVVGGGSTADVQPDEGTPGTAPGGTADIRPAQGVAPTSVDPGSTAGLLPGATQVPAAPDTSGDVDQSDRGVKGVKPSKDRGVKNAPVTTG
jgi:hypothetical protein